MNSRDYYRVIYGYDVEKYLEKGIRYCAIYIKNTESLNDDLLVKYTDGSKRRVAGMYLFTDSLLALEYVNEQRQKILLDIEFKIKQLEFERDRINEIYLNLPPVEDAQIINT